MSRNRATRPLIRYSLWPERYRRRPTTTSPGFRCIACFSAAARFFFRKAGSFESSPSAMRVLRRIAVRRIRILNAFLCALCVLCVKGFAVRPEGAVRNPDRPRRGRFALLRPQHKLRRLSKFRINQGQRDFRQAQRRPLGGPVKNAVGHPLGAQRFVALLAQHPGNGVHDIGFAAAIRPDDAGEPGAAESDMRLFAKRFEAHQLDFAQFKQDFPFVASAVYAPGGTGSRESLTPSPLPTYRQKRIPLTREGSSRDKIAEGSFSSGPAAWRYDGGTGK